MELDHLSIGGEYHFGPREEHKLVSVEERWTACLIYEGIGRGRKKECETRYSTENYLLFKADLMPISTEFPIGGNVVIPIYGDASLAFIKIGLDGVLLLILLMTIIL